MPDNSTKTGMPRIPDAPEEKQPSQPVQTDYQGWKVKPDIGVWGPPSTGKTVFIAALLQALERIRVTANSKNMHYVVRPPFRTDPGQTESSVEQAERFLDISAGFKDGSWPLGTDKDDIKPFSVYLTLKDDGTGTLGRFHNLGVFDAAGEHTRTGRKNAYWEYLRQVRVILFILSADRDQRANFFEGAHSYNSLIQSFLNNTNESASQQHLAVVITKMDKVYTPGHTVPTPDPETTLTEIIGSDLSRKLKTRFEDRMQIFQTSAAGWCRDPNNPDKIVSNMEEDSKSFVNPKDWQPWNLVTCIAWVMDCMEEIRLREDTVRKSAQNTTPHQMNCDPYEPIALIRKKRVRTNKDIVEAHFQSEFRDKSNPLNYAP